MLKLNFTTEEWKHTPELATSLYAAFPWRTKRDLRECVDPFDLTLVARHHGFLAGFAMIDVDFRHPDAGCRDSWPCITWLVVTKCFRRWRVGTTLLNYIYDNLGKNILSVNDNNISAIKLYTKVGYIKYAEAKYVPYSWYYRG